GGGEAAGDCAVIRAGRLQVDGDGGGRQGCVEECEVEMGDPDGRVLEPPTGERRDPGATADARLGDLAVERELELRERSAELRAHAERRIRVLACKRQRGGRRKRV